ncbi:PASTA domain-containing protein [Paucibacter sp. R3-3]|uniref:PASTA domain-containing protein n=1 Tax=Roseateles agri TaxID=3098619 RepID=A0ABU5DPW5_9BURK|nr:PASTA domain-containing protein [Paucibacter sp. R3-3]MDY0747768.1 PASTA domain-containing protein [Paucibacter sp. R3-3]
MFVVVLAVSGWMAWPVRMPDLTGKSLAVAQSAGLPGGVPEITEQESLTVPAGHVIDQSPEAGVRVSRFERARLVVAKLPPAVDLSAHVRIRDIGSEGTIAAAALAVAMEVAFGAVGRKVELSERYLYERAKWMDRDRAMEGSFMSPLVATAEQYGAPPLVQWPYVVGEHKPPAGQTWDKLDEAAASHTVRCTRLDGLDDVYAALRRNRPVLVAVTSSAEWGSETAMKTGVVKISGEVRPEGSMAITLIGFDPARGMYRFAHGWSVAWGDHGFGTIDRASLQAILQNHELWAVEPEARTSDRASSAAGR